jgi:hypothetical protein
MSEEQESTGSSLKKTLLGTLATIITAGGAWLGSTLFGGGSDEPAPAQAAPVINITNSNQQSQQQSAGGGKTVIIKEKEVAAKPQPEKPKKEADEFKEKPAAW